jgi:uncharacterized protein YbjT (DUF2867 family)
MKILIAGATGATGRKIVQEVTKQKIPARGLVRDLAKVQSAQGKFPQDLELCQGDVLNPKTLAVAIEGCDMVICATGARPSLNPTGPLLVDWIGSKNLVDAAVKAQVKQFVLVSSLCVSRFFHPLNLFFFVLAWKKKAEAYLCQSGLTYTIVRPGGLRSEDTPLNPIVMEPADRLFEGSIPRIQVAQICVAALSQPGAQNKIVEVVTRPNAPQRDLQQLFNGL